MTLEEMILETAKYCDITLVKVGSDYTPASDADKIKMGLNQAYRKICREKFFPTKEETLSSGESLSQQYRKILGVRVSGYSIPFEVIGDGINYDSTEDATVIYEYVPQNLTSLTSEPVIPESIMSHSVLCFYAAYMYLLMDDDSERAAQYLNLFNDGYENISNTRIKATRIRDVYGGFTCGSSGSGASDVRVTELPTGEYGGSTYD